MTITVSVTKDVTSLSVTDSVTQLNIVPQTTSIALQNIAITQSNNASVIGYTPSGHLEATTIQAALDEIAASPEFTAALNTKLQNLSASADETNTANVVSALSAGSNISIAEDGTIAANVLGAISGGTGIDIDAGGVISVSDIAIATVQTAADETAHLALTTQQGDVVIRTDVNKSYIHNGGTAGTMADFTELATNTNGVISINGATGAVTFGKSNLNDYSANEFIDWTISQTENIHADNYTNTTYSAGTGIQISESNEISATGGGSGGTSFTASGNINLDNQNNLDTISNPLFDEVRFSSLDGTADSGVLIKRFPIELYTSGLYGEGLGIFFNNNGNEQVVGAILETGFAVLGEFDTNTGLKIAGYRFLFEAQGWDERGGVLATGGQQYVAPQVYNFETDTATFNAGSGDNTRQDHRNHNLWIHPNTSVFMRDEDDGGNISGDYNLVNKKYVDDNLNNLNVPNLPNVSGTTSEDKQYLLAGSNSYSSLGFNTFLGASVHVSGGMHFGLVDQNVSTTKFGLRLEAGSGVTLNRTNDFHWTINANPDGLPDQTSGTDGYVLTSVNESAAWQPVGNVVFPTQSANTIGYVLTSNGLTAQWQPNDSYPSQTDNSGKFLQTFNGSVRWAEVDALPTQSTNTSSNDYSAGKFLASNGDNAYWHVPSSSVPDQDSHNGKFLTTNGSQLSWSTINTAGTTGNISFSTNTISSSDTSINIDDDLNVQGVLDAERLDVSGAGAPTIESIGAFNITAPDGVYCNQKRVDVDTPFAVLYISFTANMGQITNSTFIGERYNGSPTAPNMFIQSSGNGKQIVISSVGANAASDYFVEVAHNYDTFITRDDEPVRIGVHKSGSQVNIVLAQGDSVSAPEQSGMVKVKYYAV